MGFPDIQTLEPLAEALGITLTELMKCQKMQQQEVSVQDTDAVIEAGINIAKYQQKMQRKKMMQGFAEKNYIKLSMVLPASFAMIYWVRDYFGGGIREVVWSPILCCLIPLFILKRFVFPKTPKSKRETK